MTLVLVVGQCGVNVQPRAKGNVFENESVMKNVIRNLSISISRTAEKFDVQV